MACTYDLNNALRAGDKAGDNESENRGHMYRGHIVWSRKAQMHAKAGTLKRTRGYVRNKSYGVVGHNVNWS